MAALSLTVNGRSVSVDVDPDTPLLNILTDDLQLNGPKFGCGLSECGACTVLLDGEPTRSCTALISDAAGRTVLTIEGLSPSDEKVLVLWRDVDATDNEALDDFFRKQAFKTKDSEFDRIYELFPRLTERRDQPAEVLSGGERQMLVIGRALIARPRILLLDEPSLGLAPKLVDQVFEIVEGIRSEATSVLLVEQNALQALGRADRAYVMESGTTTLTGTGKELLGHPEVRLAYLGL